MAFENILPLFCGIFGSHGKTYKKHKTVIIYTVISKTMEKWQSRHLKFYMHMLSKFFLAMLRAIIFSDKFSAIRCQTCSKTIKL